MYVYDSYTLFESKGSLYHNNLFCVIYDRLAMFTQIGAYSVASADRGVALNQEEFLVANVFVAGAALPQCLKVTSNRFGGWHSVTLPPARRFLSAWSPHSPPRLERAALLVLSAQPSSSSAPTGGPPTRAL